LLNITRKKAIFKNDVVALDLILGDNFRYNLDYYIDNGFHWSFGFKSKLSQFNKTSMTDFNGGKTLSTLGLNSINIDYLDFSNQAYLQTIFAQKFLFGGGLENKYITISSNSIKNDITYFDKSNYLSVFGFLKYDSFSNKYFPKKGWYFVGDFQSYLSSSDYRHDFSKFSTLKADAAIVQTFFKKIAVKVQSEGGFVVGNNGNDVFDFVLGGYGFSKINNFRPFYGYDFLGISGNSYVKGSLAFDYEIIKKNHLNFTANFANVGENIFDSKEWISHPKYTGYGLGYGIETLIGPIEVKHSWSPDTKNHYTWVSVGFWF
jgi:NTE family protein